VAHTVHRRELQSEGNSLHVPAAVTLAYQLSSHQSTTVNQSTTVRHQGATTLQWYMLKLKVEHTPVSLAGLRG
jgi:hypothetical protein